MIPVHHPLALFHILGLDNASGGWYLWWSGIFGDVTVFAAAGMFLLHRNCHVKGCWRLGRHTVDGTGYVTCRKHHPDQAPSAEDVRVAHRAARSD